MTKNMKLDAAMWLSFVTIIAISTLRSSAKGSTKSKSDQSQNVFFPDLGLNLDSVVTTYNKTTEKCCAGSVFPLTSEMECCDGISYSKKHEICCLNHVTGEQKLIKIPNEIMAEGADAINHVKCCGIKLYDDRTQKCCLERRRRFHFPPRMHTRDMIFHTSNFRDIIMEFHAQYFVRMLQMRYLFYLRRIPLFIILNIHDTNKTCTARNFRGRSIDFNRLEQRAIRVIKERNSLLLHCNNEIYNFTTHICCSVRTNTKDGVVVESRLHKLKTTFTHCCGLETFDFTKQICCNHRKIHDQNKEHTLMCCGDEVYDYTTQQCCQQSNSSVLSEVLQQSHDSCCGDSKIPFNSKTEACCGNEIITDIYAKMCCNGVQHEKKTGISCCGVDVYNSTSELCCMGNIIARLSKDDECCGHISYNSKTKLCCLRYLNVVDKREANDDACCGTTTYNFNNATCCAERSRLDFKKVDYQLYPGRKFHWPCCGINLLNYTNQGCCGSTIFDREKQLCCADGNEVVVVNGFRGAKCCGRVAFDPIIQRCCNGMVVQVKRHFHQCCGSALFDPNEEICCNGKIHVPDDLSKTKCCDENVYHDSKEICCRGVVKDVDDPKTASCCFLEN